MTTQEPIHWDTVHKIVRPILVRLRKDIRQRIREAAREMYLAISEHFDQTQTSEHDQEEAVVHYIKNMIVAARMPFRDGKRTVGIVRQEVLELRRELGH